MADKIERIACYIRVSTQEQKLHGISLDAQRDKLRRYAEENGFAIAGWYEDEGISGTKPIKRRPALQRMLDDAALGLFDRIVFIKIDRYFRSVAEYYACQKILDQYNVLWTATEERYDLSTASGRYWVNQKLSMAEYEAGHTSERIKLVNEYKVRSGQALIGARCQGYGFTVVKDEQGVKRVVKNPETQELVSDFIRHYMTHHNKRQAYLYVKDKYASNVSYKSLSLTLKDTKLCGEYRGNPDYCEAYVSRTDFDRIQEILRNNVKTGSSRRVYLFSGLLLCPHCGSRLAASYNNAQRSVVKGKVYSYNHEYYTYRCQNHNVHATCDYSKRINESKLEAQLLERFALLLTAHVESVMVVAESPERKNAEKTLKALSAERDRLNRIYRKGGMTDAEYDREYDALSSRIQAAERSLQPVAERDVSLYTSVLQSDWKAIYAALTKENKRSFWRRYIAAIHVDDSAQLSDITFH